MKLSTRTKLIALTTISSLAVSTAAVVYYIKNTSPKGKRIRKK